MNKISLLDMQEQPQAAQDHKNNVIFTLIIAIIALTIFGLYLYKNLMYLPCERGASKFIEQDIANPLLIAINKYDADPLALLKTQYNHMEISHVQMDTLTTATGYVIFSQHHNFPHNRPVKYKIELEWGDLEWKIKSAKAI